MATYQDLIRATNKCTDKIREMIPMEKDKRLALISDDTVKLEELLHSQQAVVMQLERLEYNRLSCQKEMGLELYSADELVEQAPEAEKAKLIDCFSNLREAAAELKELNAKAVELAKASSQFWESMESSKGSTAANKTTYQPNGKTGSGWSPERWRRKPREEEERS